MNTRERFGKYLLLKKLTEDPLGETFRAGLLSTGGMERVTLLRIFNGQGLEGPRLWDAVQGREGIQKLLHSPNIGEGVEMGELQGIPYVAYDYVSGKNMATLLEQAAKKQNFIPAEHALLITERLALALAAACENRHAGERILHGFLVPQLTMISNEGEIRLLGFEVAPGLRSFAANPVIRQHFGRYLAPEALSGTPPAQADDIYSLGVILFELLTGRPLPPPAVDGYGSLIDQGMLGAEGEPIPPALVELLKSSLVARAERINDVAVWHKNLNTWLFEGQYNPTTFNLAFFMHNLFREEIERESQEIEVEKTLPLPVVQQPEPTPMPAAAPTAPPQPLPVGEDSGVSEATENFIPEYAREAEKSKLGLYIAITVVVVAILGGIFWWTTQRGGAPEPPPEETVAAAPEPTPEPPAEEAPPAPTQAEVDALMAQIDELVNQKASDMAAELRAQQDEQLQALRRQLDDARQAAELRRQQLEQQRAEQEAREQAAAAAEAEAEAARLAEEEAAAEEAAAVDVAEVAAQPESPPEPTPPPPPPKPQVRRGDLVQPGPGVVTPRVKRLVPRYPPMARRLGKATVVTVKVLVDENGKANQVKLEGKKVGFGFDSEALQAARSATYQAATKNGVPVKCWLTVKVEFQPR